MKDRMEVKVTSEDINTQADALADLPVADEQAEETKGGIGSTVTWTYKVTNTGN